MKVWQIQSFGIDQLALADLPQPRPGRGEVLIKVHAASLNYRDLRMVLGQYNPKMALPRIPCSDGAGEVVNVIRLSAFEHHCAADPPTIEKTLLQ